MKSDVIFAIILIKRTVMFVKMGITEVLTDVICAILSVKLVVMIPRAIAVKTFMF